MTVSHWETWALAV